MTQAMIIRHLKDAGAKNLREFGYPQATAENILHDYIFREMFKKMLDDNEGQKPEIDAAISVIREEIINQVEAELAVKHGDD